MILRLEKDLSSRMGSDQFTATRTHAQRRVLGLKKSSNVLRFSRQDDGLVASNFGLSPL